MAISEKKRLTFTAIAVILVGIITGLLLGSALSSGASPTKTFTIIAYHWGYALYDENWKEIEQIEVKRGTTVRLIAFSDAVISNEMHEQLWRRTINKGFGQYPPGDPRIYDLLVAAHYDPALGNHGILIPPLNVDIRFEHVASPEEGTASVEFKTDAIGSFDIMCSVACGVGHPYMVLKGALVVK